MASLRLEIFRGSVDAFDTACWTRALNVVIVEPEACARRWTFGSYGDSDVVLSRLPIAQQDNIACIFLDSDTGVLSFRRLLDPRLPAPFPICLNDDDVGPAAVRLRSGDFLQLHDDIFRVDLTIVPAGHFTTTFHPNRYTGASSASGLPPLMQCCVCHETMRFASTAPCGHSACDCCLRQWAERQAGSSPCPVCRVGFLASDIVPNFHLRDFIEHVHPRIVRPSAPPVASQTSPFERAYALLVQPSRDLPESSPSGTSGADGIVEGTAFTSDTSGSDSTSAPTPPSPSSPSTSSTFMGTNRNDND